MGPYETQMISTYEERSKNAGWKDAKTAPVDREVLAYWKGGRMAVAYYTGREDVVWNNPLWIVEDEPERFAPVYWMPLPEQPIVR